MPTYDYKCRACGKDFEFFQSISEQPKTKCPACGKRQLERLLGTGVEDEYIFFEHLSFEDIPGIAQAQ